MAFDAPCTAHGSVEIVACGFLCPARSPGTSDRLTNAATPWRLGRIPPSNSDSGDDEAGKLKANPNVLECLYSPIVEKITPLGQELLQLRQSFLSKLVFQTYSGYVASQFKKMQADIRNHGTVKWKHVMHLIRLLMSGLTVLKERQVMVEVGEHRERRLLTRHGRKLRVRPTPSRTIFLEVMTPPISPIQFVAALGVE